MTEPENFPLNSLDIKEQQLEKLKSLFPEVFTEGTKIDWDRLKNTLGNYIDPGKERFGLNWPGKAECFRTIQQPSMATLTPCPEESLKADGTPYTEGEGFSSGSSHSGQLDGASGNLFIEGDNLEVLKLLQKSYQNKVKMIYIDPPYNTGNEFIYPDNYSETLDTYLEYTGQTDGEGRKFSTNVDTDGRFHSKWLNMIYPRLFLAKNLLQEDGVLFISIGQTELANLVLLANEIFGEDNRIGLITRVMKSGGGKGKFFSPNTEYILVFAKDPLIASNFRDDISSELADKVYNQIEKEGPKKGEFYRTMGLYQSSLDARANQRYFIQAPDGSLVIPPGNSMPEIKREGEKVRPLNNEEGVWRWTYETYVTEKAKGNIEFKKSKSGVLLNSEGETSSWNIYTKIWLKDRQEDGRVPVDFIDKFENRHSSKELQELGIPFDFAKPSDLIAYLVKIVGFKKDEILLDFFSGSSTSAHGILKQAGEERENFKFILVQLPEPTDEKSEAFNAGFRTISELGKERIRKVSVKIKTDQKAAREKAQGELFKNDNVNENLDLGFHVFKLQTSHFKVWDAGVAKDTEAIQTQLFNQVEHISAKASQEDILFELLLKAGFRLDTRIESLSLAAKQVFSIADGELLICLEKELTHEVITAMAELQPSRVICLDLGFQNNDQLKTNAVQIMKSKKVLNFQTV
jgi:adenine-specific DNA-methyltransferase